MTWLLVLHETQPIAHTSGDLGGVSRRDGPRQREVPRGRAGNGRSPLRGIPRRHFGEEVDHGPLDFVKEFGLILFVFTIGLQLGPGFFAALRKQG